MANTGDHDHYASDDKHEVHYARTTDGELYDTGQRLPRGALKVEQHYVDHAGRPTTVQEYEGSTHVYVGNDQEHYWAKRRIVEEAQQLAASKNWKRTGDRFEELLQEWKVVGRIDKGQDQQLWSQFNSARLAFRAERQQHFDQLKSAQADAAVEKSRLASRAEALAGAGDTKAASEEMKRLLDEWKRAGRADRHTDEQLWSRFDGARKRLADRRQREFDQRKTQWAQNKAAKEQIVRAAESLAAGSDLRAAGEQMRALSDKWKQIGPCEKTDNDALWSRFTGARNRLHERKQQQFERRKQESAANRARKESVVAQAESLANSTDFPSARDGMRALTDQWKQIGPCEKADNERLWARFSAAKDRLRERSQRDFEARKAERRQRAADSVSRLEAAMWNAEAAIARANESYSRALSARSPSMSNPNWYSISNRQQERVAQARQRVIAAENRRSEILSKLSTARARLNSL